MKSGQVSTEIRRKDASTRAEGRGIGFFERPISGGHT